MRMKALAVLVVGVFVAVAALTAMPRAQSTPLQARKTANVWQQWQQQWQQAFGSFTGNQRGFFGFPIRRPRPVTGPGGPVTTASPPAPGAPGAPGAGAPTSTTSTTASPTIVSTQGSTRDQDDSRFWHIVRRWTRPLRTLPPPADLCLLTPPANPLSAQGLATPWQLSGTTGGTPCTEENATTAVFVEATILDPTTGQLAAYDPLVVDAGTQPAAAPVVPTLPRNSVVALWIGANTTVVLPGGVRGCTDGVDSVFTQQAYCNVPQFLQAVNRELNRGGWGGGGFPWGHGFQWDWNWGSGNGWGFQRGRIQVPPIGTARDGKPCPTARDFSIVDQDQSDNTYTHYLIVNNQVAQDTTANRNQFGNGQVTFNGSDEGTVVPGVDAALGCKPWAVTDLADPQQTISTGILNEIQAAVYQRQPIALVPAEDDFVLNPAVTGVQDLRKLNLYRQQVDQAQVGSLNQANTTTYCQNLLNVGLPRIAEDQQFTQNQPSPFPATANNLFTFLATRFMATFQDQPGFLHCTALLHVQNPVTVTMDGNGVVVSATINLHPGPATSPTPTASPTATASPSPTASPIGGPTPVSTVTPAASLAPGPTTVDLGVPTSQPSPGRRRGR